ncbi:MAG: hypothetical protein E7641_02970 [Ruminococcaceae bacterium]|nr:hypothetical protein [Oscillospiraceae bacterium]
MFGYIKTHTPELKVSEHEYYKSAYCGLCRAMGKCTGQCSRMTLSYDFAFMAILRIALRGTEVSFSRKRCIAHPFKKRTVMDSNPELRLCAFAAALLTYHKTADDLADEKGRKKALALLFKPFASSMRKKALKKGELSELDRYIAEKLAELSRFEASGEASVDTPAEIFGEMLSRILAFGLSGVEEKLAENIGYHVGKWIYIIDALDDFSEDVEKNRYNPFALLYGKTLSEKERSLISDALKNELCDIEKAYDLIDFEGSAIPKNIIANVFYLGMPKTLDRVLFGPPENDK